MMKNTYKNPMSNVYQYEYALYMLVSNLFEKIISSSRVITTLRLYYAELVKESKETGHLSYEKQYLMEEEIQKMITRDLVGKITFPGINRCRAKLTVRTSNSGLHIFRFSDGIYGFEVFLELKRDKRTGAAVITGRPKGILIRNITGFKEN